MRSMPITPRDIIALREESEICETDEQPEDFGCDFPDRCVMPGVHYPNECHTAIQADIWRGAIDYFQRAVKSSVKANIVDPGYLEEVQAELSANTQTRDDEHARPEGGGR